MIKVNKRQNTPYHILPFINKRSGKTEERYLWILNCLVDEVKEVRYKNQFTNWEKQFIEECITPAINGELTYGQQVKLEEIYRERQQL